MFSAVILSTFCIALAQPSIESSHDGSTVKINADNLHLVRLNQSSSLNIGQAISDALHNLALQKKSVASNTKNVSDILARLDDLDIKVAAADHSDRIDVLEKNMTNVQRSLSTTTDTLMGKILKLENKTDDLLAGLVRLEQVIKDLNNNTAEELKELEGRISANEEELFHHGNTENGQVLIENGGFENQTDASTYCEQCSLRRQSFQLIDISNDYPKETPYRSALVINAIDDLGDTEYEVISDRTIHPKLCAGTYLFSCYLKVSGDYDGVPMIFHHRFFQSGMSVSDWAQQNEEVAQSIGAWPKQRDTWEKIEVRKFVKSNSDVLRWFFAYPFRANNGNITVTGLNVVRLGGDGSC